MVPFTRGGAGGRGSRGEQGRGAAQGRGEGERQRGAVQGSGEAGGPDTDNITAQGDPKQLRPCEVEVHDMMAEANN